jgi:hypothetical protein
VPQWLLASIFCLNQLLLPAGGVAEGTRQQQGARLGVPCAGADVPGVGLGEQPLLRSRSLLVCYLLSAVWSPPAQLAAID